MMSNGTWYATETPCKTSRVNWLPLRRIPDDTASHYNLGGRPTPFAHAARVLRDGRLALT